MRGGPIDLTPFGSAIGAIGVAYWCIALAFAFLVSRLGKRLWVQLLLGAATLVVFIAPAAWHYHGLQQQARAAKARLDESMALFHKRCETAGEKIFRQVDGVDGVVWMKWRPKDNHPDDQFRDDDPYGKDCSGEDCIKALLRVTQGAELYPEEAAHHTRGFRYVESVAPGGSGYVRYVGVMKLRPIWTPEAIARQTTASGKGIEPDFHEFGLERQPIDKPTARYGITWDDISTREDREHWIAGGSLKVIDLQTKEVIAERVGYMIDEGQGNTAGFRSTWAFAERQACPAFPRIGRYDSRRMRTSRETLNFALIALKPPTGEQP